MSVPSDNRQYKSQSYWDERFKEEASYEWLLEFEQVKPLLKQHGVIPSSSSNLPRVLVVGCGNSNFSKDLFDAGVTNLVSIDFSEEVIRRMRERQPSLEWRVMDMTDMKGFDGDVFDIVLDKAAMDALVTDEGDPWNPSQSSIESTSNMMAEVFRVLKPSGKFIQISFQQPHFRRKYLQQGKFAPVHVAVDEVDVGMGYFLYAVLKPSDAPS